MGVYIQRFRFDTQQDRDDFMKYLLKANNAGRAMSLTGVDPDTRETVFIVEVEIIK